MDEYRVILSSRAERDADDIYAWIAQRSSLGASKWFSAFGEMLRRLQNEPVRHGPAPESHVLGLDIKQALFKTRHGHTYRALFTLAGDTVHVIAVRGAGEELVTPNDIDLPT